ncbi:MAG: hypothetical protein ABR569_09020, partial [Gaiellaceae bacterium]
AVAGPAVTEVQAMTAAELGPDELPDGLDAGERAALGATAARLIAARPLPSAAFRGELRRMTLGPAGLLPRRPTRLRQRILGFVVVGAALVGLAASGLTGAGPLAPRAGGAAHVAEVR